MQTGYNEATGMGCSSLAQDLVLCEQAGFDYIEIRLDMLAAYLQEHDVEELEAFFAGSHLAPHAFNALYTYPELFSEQDDPARREALLEEFLLGCRVGQRIGAGYFIIVPPLQRDPNGGPFVGDEAATHRNCVRILKELARIAAPFGIKLCFEIVGFERSSVRSVQQADRIVREVGRADVGYVMDAYNLYLNGGLNDFSCMELVEPEKIFAVHINNADDVPPEERGQDKRLFPGPGAVDLAGFLGTLKRIGYEGMVSVETFRPAYWQQSPEWVISNAYRTTCACLAEQGCTGGCCIE